MCIFGDQESAQLSRLLDVLLSLSEYAVNSGLLRYVEASQDGQIQAPVVWLVPLCSYPFVLYMSVAVQKGTNGISPEPYRLWT